MSKSGELRLTDTRPIFRLVADCRDLGQDVVAWNQLLTTSANKLFNAIMTNSFLYSVDPTTVMADVQLFFDAWVDEAARTIWYDFHLQKKYRIAPSIVAFVKPYTNIKVARRQELIPDAEWHTCWEHTDIRRRCGQDEFIYTATPLHDLAGRYFGMSFNRGVREPAFSLREKAQIALLQEELYFLFGKRLQLVYSNSPTGLRLRLQQILAALQSGASEKKIAADLNLSKYTVHDYVRELYKLYGVSSRAQLIAACRSNKV